MTNKNNQYDAAVNYGNIQQAYKKNPGEERKPVSFTTPIQAVFDGKTGASLEAILAQFNSIYVQYQGTPKDTRLIIPKEMRRAGLTITYMDMESNTITERANSAVQKDNDHWALDVNWSRVDDLSLSGDISVSAAGTWIINGKDTGVKALGPKGDTGLTPWLKAIENRLHFSYDNITWEPCSDNIAAWFRWSGNKIQISRDNKTWTDLSGKFADNVHIKGYVADTSALPTNALQGDVYGVGPTYAAEDTAHSNPIYRYYVRNANSWVDNGNFTSISAGVVQETGNSETEVMSQKAVTEKLSELESNVNYQLLSGKYDLGLIADKYVTTDGRIADTTGWSCTRFLPCKGMKEINVKGNQIMSSYNCWFDNDGKFISAFDLPIGESFLQVPDNASSFVLSGETTYIEKITVVFPINLNSYLQKGGSAYNFKITSAGVGHIPIYYNFKKGHRYKISNNSAYTDNAGAYISDGINKQSISGVGRNKSMTFVAEINATYYDAYFNNTDIDIEIFDVTTDTELAISETSRELYDGEKVFLTIKETIAGVGYVTYPVAFKKGNKYRVANHSTKTEFTLNIQRDNLIVQAITGLAKGGNVVFTALEDGDSIYGYFNNTEVDIEISILSNTLHDKVDSIVNATDFNKSIAEYNKDKITAMKAAVYPPFYSISQYGDGDTPYMPMVMFQTDQHDDFDSINRALEFADENKEVVCSVSLGDLTTYDLLSKDVATLLFTKSNKPFFRLMGNHEIEVNGNISQLHDIYYNSDIVSKNGENKPSNKLYWYYDILLPSEPNKKLRMVGLFQFEKGTNEAFYSMEQLSWLADLLNNTDDNTYIVMLSHYNVNTWNKVDAYNDEFTPIPIYRASGYTVNGGANSADAIVDAWINGKSVTLTIDGNTKTFSYAKPHKAQFFCWISGHHHEDAIFRLSKYPEQINISLDTTCNFQYQCGFGDLPRRKTDKTRDSVTLIGFDWYNRRINIIRLGSDVTKDLRDRKYISFDLP